MKLDLDTHSCPEVTRNQTSPVSRNAGCARTKNQGPGVLTLTAKQTQQLIGKLVLSHLGFTPQNALLWQVLWLSELSPATPWLPTSKRCLLSIEQKLKRLIFFFVALDWVADCPAFQLISMLCLEEACSMKSPASRGSALQAAAATPYAQGSR